MARLVVSLVFQAMLFTALVMGTAWAITGHMDWPRGWITLALLLLVSAAGGFWLLGRDPDLVRERAALPAPKSPADTLATLLIALSVIGWFVFAVWDVHALQLVSMMPELSFVAGLVIYALGVAAITWTFRVNSFAATVVKVQEDRQQRVIDTGPYALVRHPMYLGSIVFFVGLGLILGSAAAAVLALPLFFLAFLPRRLREERVLRRDLPGYLDYQSRVRARILPGLL